MSITYEGRLPGTGDFTGKCWRCGSHDLWDDVTGYGCNECGMIRMTTEVRVCAHTGEHRQCNICGGAVCRECYGSTPPKKGCW